MNYNELKPFKRLEIESGRRGWVVDLSPKHEVNPDCYWMFDKYNEASLFITLLQDGFTPREAIHIVYHD